MQTKSLAEHEQLITEHSAGFASASRSLEGTSGHIRYRPYIDGLRAVAVMPVVLCHAGFATFSGGFVGVDVFFVISGFLITSLIMSDLEGGKFSLLRFYERRIRRIFPPSSQSSASVRLWPGSYSCRWTLHISPVA